MSAMPPEIDLTNWIDLSGLSGPVAANIRQLVESLREAQATTTPPKKPYKSIEGIFSQLKTGPGLSGEELKQLKREAMTEHFAILKDEPDA